MRTEEATLRQVAERVHAAERAGGSAARLVAPQENGALRQPRIQPEALPIEAGLKGRIIQAKV